MVKRLISMLLLGATVAAGVGACSKSKFCEQCGRTECGNMTFSVELRGGKKVETCCPRCGLHFIESTHPAVASLSVRDFDTADRLDATRAFYVEGSDISPCTMDTSGPPRDERGCCMRPLYDRCLPSLLAFRSRSSAETFARDHGGAIKAFADLQAGRH